MMTKLNFWDWLAFILVIIGALNWGLVGFLNWDLVAAIFGAMSTISRIVYALVGLAGIYMLFAMPMYMRKEKQ
ncbi:MAG: DUF378 domain-containing protein [Patescibacteria group bacterium]|nr:DUF378 domain-containing protein [Patescibacteria group bacterium]